MDTIKEILMRRDGLRSWEAEEVISGARDKMLEFLQKGDLYSAENICKDEFGLEPDYIIELL